MSSGSERLLLAFGCVIAAIAAGVVDATGLEVGLSAENAYFFLHVACPLPML